jgi:superoxide dismutase, Cu-Zn family
MNVGIVDAVMVASQVSGIRYFFGSRGSYDKQMASQGATEPESCACFVRRPRFPFDELFAMVPRMTRRLLALPVALLGLAGCTAGGVTPSAQSSATVTTGPTASALMRDASGNTLGRLTIAQTGSGLTVSGTLTGVPAGTHGIHVHAVGQCDAPGFTTAGGHWNPTANAHGFENPRGPHHGDMRNVVADASGRVDVSTSTAAGGAGGLFDADGSAIVIHAAADDYRTDPAGNSGARIACGVVTR